MKHINVDDVIKRFNEAASTPSTKGEAIEEMAQHYKKVAGRDPDMAIDFSTPFSYTTVQRNKTGSVVVNRGHWNHVNHYRIGRNFVENQRRRRLIMPKFKKSFNDFLVNGYCVD